MSLYKYLELQPVDPRDDGTISELDMYAEDETIDLSRDEDGDTLARKWEEMTKSLHGSNNE